MRDAAYREIARYCRKLLREEAENKNNELLRQLGEWALECDADADRSVLAFRGNKVLEQARRYRARAEEHRAIADQLDSPPAIATYRHLAETYEAMARKLEEPLHRARQRDAG